MPIYEISDWQALQSQIEAGGKAVSGMTPAEAQAALKTQTITTQSGSTLHVYNPGATPSAQPPLQFPGTEQPVDAYWEYVNKGGSASAGGAATSGSATVSNSNLTITKTAGGATGVAGLLSMNLPTAAAAIAPVAGFAIGAGLYTLNPELWTKISKALLPFCYPDTELLPVITDEKGNTYFSEGAIKAVEKVIKDSSGDETGSSEFFNLAEYVSPYPFPVVTASHAHYLTNYSDTQYENLDLDRPVGMVVLSGVIDGTAYVWAYCASSSSFRYKTYTSDAPSGDPGYTPSWSNASAQIVNDKTVYYATLVQGRPINTSPGVTGTQLQLIGSDPHAQLNYAIAYGVTAQPPSGIEKWNGAQYPPTPQPIDVFTRYNDVGDAEFLPFYPVTVPVGDPGVSASPLEVPDPPTTNPNPAPAINPWISPSPAPNTYPGDVPQSNPAQLPGNVPNYTPNLNPESDPSQEPAPEPAPEPDPAPNENSSGTSPIPIIPEFPALPSAASGLLHVYNPTQGQIDAFGSWLWTTFSGDLIDTVSKLFNDPMDAVIGLHELYATPATSGSSTIRAGFLDSGVSSKLVAPRYTSINCGSVVVPEYYQNYLDYSPYTKCFVYLPFVGIVPVSADDIIGNAVQIKYNVDSYTGCCIAIITVARAGYSSTVYQFEGNCGVEIPITSGYQSTLIGGLLGVAGTAISGSPHVGLAAASLGRANLGKNEVSHSGSFGSSYGAMGAKIPYIIVKRPTQKSVVNYNDEYGFPAHKRVKIGECSGYLRAREVHVISPTATDEEKKRIEEMLKEGVFVK